MSSALFELLQSKKDTDEPGGFSLGSTHTKKRARRKVRVRSRGKSISKPKPNFLHSETISKTIISLPQSTHFISLFDLITAKLLSAFHNQNGFLTETLLHSLFKCCIGIEYCTTSLDTDKEILPLDTDKEILPMQLARLLKTKLIYVLHSIHENIGTNSADSESETIWCTRHVRLVGRITRHLNNVLENVDNENGTAVKNRRKTVDPSTRELIVNAINPLLVQYKLPELKERVPTKYRYFRCSDKNGVCLRNSPDLNDRYEKTRGVGLKSVPLKNLKHKVIIVSRTNFFLFSYLFSIRFSLSTMTIF